MSFNSFWVLLSNTVPFLKLNLMYLLKFVRKVIVLLYYNFSKKPKDILKKIKNKILKRVDLIFKSYNGVFRTGKNHKIKCSIFYVWTFRADCKLLCFWYHSKISNFVIIQKLRIFKIINVDIEALQENYFFSLSIWFFLYLSLQNTLYMYIIKKIQIKDLI